MYRATYACTMGNVTYIWQLVPASTALYPVARAVAVAVAIAVTVEVAVAVAAALVAFHGHLQSYATQQASACISHCYSLACKVTADTWGLGCVSPESSCTVQVSWVTGPLSLAPIVLQLCYVQRGRPRSRVCLACMCANSKCMGTEQNCRTHWPCFHL